ncbi:hypothetical protein JKF63_06798 [Porcisia hertigi]|uniref:Uncharacterized protein n=1 Tax=Porcisia hertigi TaxID=2761500 RepID=A0A836LJ53_9TRYP|nr:hypothetical protein JKF63_06798 [Porcisia hertigi]
MNTESAEPPCGAATFHESTLEKQLEEEAEKRCDAEHMVEESQRKSEPLETEARSLRRGCSSQAGLTSRTSLVHEGSSLPLVTKTGGVESCESSLRAENSRLKQLVKRQSALIDVLRRQKVLLEASVALNISARDFNQYLELNKP